MGKRERLRVLAAENGGRLVKGPRLQFEARPGATPHGHRPANRKLQSFKLRRRDCASPFSCGACFCSVVKLLNPRSRELFPRKTAPRPRRRREIRGNPDGKFRSSPTACSSLLSCVRSRVRHFPAARNASCSSLTLPEHDAEWIMIIHGARVLLSTASSMHYVESSSSGNKPKALRSKKGSADSRKRLEIDSNVHSDYPRLPVQSSNLRGPLGFFFQKLPLEEEREVILNRLKNEITLFENYNRKIVAELDWKLYLCTSRTLKKNSV